MRVEGTLRIGEAAPVAARAIRPLTGHPRQLVLSVLAPLAGGFAGFVVAVVIGLVTEDASFWLNWLPLVGLLIGAWASVGLCRRWAVRRFAKAMKARGSSEVLNVEVEISDAGLLQNMGGLEHRAPWSVVSDLVLVPGYWVFLAKGTPLYLPRRYFADEAAEKAFIGSALLHMDEPGRQRSPDAMKFVEA